MLFSVININTYQYYTRYVKFIVIKQIAITVDDVIHRNTHKYLTILPGTYINKIYYNKASFNNKSKAFCFEFGAN